MKKDNVRDYVVAMFRFYSELGQPNQEQIQNLKTKLSTAAILDLIAVDDTLHLLSESGDDFTVAAVKEIYFIQPTKPLQRNELSERVVKFSLLHFVAERNVWHELKRARRICAEQRNLNIIS